MGTQVTVITQVNQVTLVTQVTQVPFVTQVTFVTLVILSPKGSVGTSCTRTGE